MAQITYSIEQVARICHQANKALCEANGDTSQAHWEDAPEWQRQSAIAGVCFRMAHPHAGPEASHVSWMLQKLSEGWTFGPEKKPELKQHPCMVPFEKLPAHQQAKDILFNNVVASVRHLIAIPY